MALRRLLETAALLGLFASTAVGQIPCGGDCNGDSVVNVNELLIMVDIALGNQPVASCTAGDVNRDGSISVEEIVGGVASALSGCPAFITGAIKCPDSSNLPECRAGRAEVQVFDFFPVGTGQSQAGAAAQGTGGYQLNLIDRFTTDENGGYQTANLSQALADRTMPIIVLASVSSAASIGGVASLPPSTNLQKELNATTQVGCIAAVAMVLGTEAAGITGAGCVVSDSCDSNPDCLPLLAPADLDAVRIGRFEDAAAVISGEVIFPDDQAAAVCAVINCTTGGAIDAKAECVRSAFVGAKSSQ